MRYNAGETIGLYWKAIGILGIRIGCEGSESNRGRPEIIAIGIMYLFFLILSFSTNFVSSNIF